MSLKSKVKQQLLAIEISYTCKILLEIIIIFYWDIDTQCIVIAEMSNEVQLFPLDRHKKEHE